MNFQRPTFESLFRCAALACLCAAGSASAADAAHAKTGAKPAAAAKATKKAPAKPVEAAPAEAGPEQVEAAERVYYGLYECEFNQTLDIEKNAKLPAYVNVKSGKSAWIMKPVLSTTGAVRLEDVKGETLMVQIASKSMLLNVKTARRVVDDCVSPKQRELIATAKAAKDAGGPTGAALLAAPQVAGAAAEVATSAPAAAASAPN